MITRLHADGGYAGQKLEAAVAQLNQLGRLADLPACAQELEVITTTLSGRIILRGMHGNF